MTETESYKYQYYNKHHENWHLYHFDRALKSFFLHLDRYLDSLDLRNRERGNLLRIWDFYLKKRVIKVKTFFINIKNKIGKKGKQMWFFIKKQILKLRSRKYKKCILIYLEKGLGPEEIIKEILSL
jgi:hypothetical protein